VFARPRWPALIRGWLYAPLKYYVGFHDAGERSGEAERHLLNSNVMRGLDNSGLQGREIFNGSVIRFLRDVGT
jgi:hypothetical protein